MLESGHGGQQTVVYENKKTPGTENLYLMSSSKEILID